LPLPNGLFLIKNARATKSSNKLISKLSGYPQLSNETGKDPCRYTVSGFFGKLWGL